MLFSKKICVTLLAAVIAASSAFAVSAANEQEVGANSAANVDVTATIEATVISATVPTQMTISINPNTGRLRPVRGALSAIRLPRWIFSLSVRRRRKAIPPRCWLQMHIPLGMI